MAKNHKRKKKQPQSKAKSKKNVFENAMHSYGKQLLELMNHKEEIATAMRENIEKIENYFRKYDTVQLLGGMGLYLINNLPNPEKYFNAQMSGKELNLDEYAEVVAEYAMNFGLSMPNDGKEVPTEQAIENLYDTLTSLVQMFSLIDMPTVDDAEGWIQWMTHSNTVSVRGDGYQVHVEEVFKEMFFPHSAFYRDEYGFSVENLFEFCTTVEKRIYSKIGSQDDIYGVYEAWKRWKEWDKKQYGKCNDDIENLKSRDFSKGIFVDFLTDNPDLADPNDPQQFLLYQPNDYTSSDKIFWIVPQGDADRKILEALSVEFGSNANFIKEGNYKGNIMNGHNIFENPIVKDGDKYYCFTPMLLHRNMFLIAERLMMHDMAYYNANFKNNTSAIGRDNYIEQKVKELFESFLPEVKFYSSVHYAIMENGMEKKPEQDILGVSNKCTYIIEVKAHELTHKDRVGVKGLKDKFSQSVTEACSQCCRSKDYILSDPNPTFREHGNTINIDPIKPVYKIAVTFQHYSILLGSIDKLIKLGLMDERYRDTWTVSLFDLMVVSEFIESEDEFLSYLDMRNEINKKGIVFVDELDLLGGFLNENLANKIKAFKVGEIFGGSKYIDDEYAKDFVLPIGKE